MVAVCASLALPRKLQVYLISALLSSRRYGPVRTGQLLDVEVKEVLKTVCIAVSCRKQSYECETEFSRQVHHVERISKRRGR